MKVHIKNVLNMNMHLDNSTMDKYISSIFNLNNVNPQYVFKLPEKNRTLIFRKSDFTAAVFPNITNVNKFKSSGKLKASSSTKYPVRVKNQELLEELKHERFIFENTLSNNDEYDDKMKEIVEENVKSEKEFIKLMNDMNDDLDEEDLRDQYHQRLSQKPARKNNRRPTKGESLKPKKNSEEDDWEEFGLSGWSGSMVGSKDKLPKREK